MRVISGTAKGRPLKAVPGKNTRPTSDKVKEALFSMIGPYFAGGFALDLFAGTGGLGIEALSRGMDKAIFIDADRTSIQVVRDNLQAAGLEDRAEVYRNDAEKALKALARRNLQFSLVFLDPPYRLGGQMEKLLTMLLQCRVLSEDALAVAEHDQEHRYAEKISAGEDGGELRQIRHAIYGDTAITIFQYVNE